MKKSKSTSAAERKSPKRTASFVAANGYRGFRSRFDEVFRTSQYEHLYIIKGGPGTGKSHAMREIGKIAEKIEADCEYVYCSSDTDSLDGLILEKNGHRIGILDGTAPHTRCTEMPGAIDEIINLGEFWDSGKLSPHRELIFSLQQKKAEAYRRAYRFLRIAGEADALLSDMLEPCLKKDKMAASISRLVRQIPDDATVSMQTRYRQACGIRGVVYLPTEAEKRVVVSDYIGSARFYLSFLQKELAKEERHSIIVFPSCYTDRVLDGILLPSQGLLFSTREEDGEASINMKRFLDSGRLAACRSEVRHLRNVCQDMQGHAQTALREAGEHHFALEALYGKAMDFAAESRYISSLSERILSALEKK